MNFKFLFSFFFIWQQFYFVFSIKVISVQTFSYHNAKISNTQKFRTVNTNLGSDLILRRGNIFTLSATLDENYIYNKTNFFAQFNFENFPATYKRSVVTIKITNNVRFNQNLQKKPDKWHADLYKVNHNVITFDIFIPINLPVGQWYMSLFFKTPNGQILIPYKIPNNIYVLFNPWSKNDDVYLPNEAERHEYVLNEVGRIYTGSTKNKEYRDWYFEQFNRGMLKAVMFIMNRSGLTPMERSDPIKTSRAISAMTNSNDEDGVVVGRWKEPYRPYRNPWEWLGSGDIIMKYYRENGNPVKYGQCWVYAGVATTIARAIGIPARPITAYASAHDTDNSLTVDKYYNLRGEELKDKSPDSVWNFHVWVEVWFRRNDIKSTMEPINLKAENWQVIDATPQETSFNGKYELGPTSVASVRSGDLSLSQDMPFVYSEVNSDVIFWYMSRNGQYYKKSIVTNSIGTIIVTKVPGGSMADITDNYKYREGTENERVSFKRARSMINLRYSKELDLLNEISYNHLDDVSTKINLNDKYRLGKPIKFNLQIVNLVNETRNVFLKLSVESIYYNGKILSTINQTSNYLKLKPGEVIDKSFTINEKDYLDKIAEMGNFKITTFTNLIDTENSLYNEYFISLLKPELKVFSKEKVFHQLKKNRVTIKMQNPLDQSLNNCKLILKDGLMCNHKEIELNNIEPHSYLLHEEEFIPQDYGKSLLIALVDCEQIHDIRGHLELTIKKNYLNSTIV